MRSSSRRRLASMGILLAAMHQGAALAVDQPLDLVALPIEQLLTLEVYSASKFVQQVSDAPSAVSVVTAADIREFGWRTLADILRSMRGNYLSNDRNYAYLGARGFLRPGDYSTRFLLLIDGVRNNDSVYDQASIGTEALVDVDLIERVEFVPGPGSSIYGANAFFGVINVITKRGRDFNGPQLAVEAGSHGGRKARATYGLHSEDGIDFLLSASTQREDGEDLYFREFDTPENNNGIARRLDHDSSKRMLLKASAGAFTLSLSHSERTKGIPTASYSQVFNDSRSHSVDTQSALAFGYHAALAADTELSTNVYWGRYDYDGDYVYDYPPLTLNRDGTRARWWGGEAKVTSMRIAQHKIIAGVEYQRDFQQDQFNYDTDPMAVGLDDRRRNSRAGAYLQDEFRLRDDLLLNAGLRYDRYSSTGNESVNPRLGLIYKASPVTTLKALYGTAFRPPNAYELYYEVIGTGGQKASPALKAERIRSHELILERRLSNDARLTASVFRNAVSQLITQTTDPEDGLLVFRNIDRAVARGVEMEYEHAWSSGERLRAAISWQLARDAETGARLVNSPRHLANLRLSRPIFNSGWRAGAEVFYVGARNTLQSRTGGYWLSNLTLSALRLAPGVQFSASVYNLFDRRYADPGSAEHAQDAIAQNGRTFRLALSCAF